MDVSKGTTVISVVLRLRFAGRGPRDDEEDAAAAAAPVLAEPERLEDDMEAWIDPVAPMPPPLPLVVPTVLLDMPFRAGVPPDKIGLQKSMLWLEWN